MSDTLRFTVHYSDGGDGWIMVQVEAGLALPGLYPANADNRARYEADKAAGRA